MNFLQRGLRYSSAILAVALLSGCATARKPDPLEPLNRAVFAFNDVADQAVVKPAATVYREALPRWVQTGVSNFFGNLQDVWSVVNQAAQLRGAQAGDNLARVMVNSTLGLGGLLDLASEMNIERHSSDFALTLGRWGVAPGPYIVLPFLGPSTLREVVAFPIDSRGNLINSVSDESVRTGLTLTRLVDTRAMYLKSADIVAAAALDKYTFTRDVYLQRQRNNDYDGNPPDIEDEPAP